MKKALFSEISKGVFEFATPFPLKIGIIGKAANSIDYSKDLDSARNEEISLLSKSCNIAKKNIFMLNQVHGDSIIIAGKDSDNENNNFPDADGCITDIINKCLVIRTADCVPVFVYDAKNKALGAVHAGWKGCRLGIASNLIKKMKSFYKSGNSDLYAYILPSIGPESYTVNMDVGELFKKNSAVKDGKIFVDLWKNIIDSLAEEGIKGSNILLSQVCTYKNNTDFFSYRRMDSGRNINYAYLEN